MNHGRTSCKMEEMETIANKTLAEKHLRKFGSFLEDHSRRLLDVTERDVGGGRKDDPSSTGYVKSYAKIHHIWDQSTCPIRLSWTPIPDGLTGFEEIISIPLPPEGNPDVQKVLLVLTNLTHQLNLLREQIHAKFIVPLLLYGDGFEEDGSLSGHDTASLSEGDGHIAIAKFIPLLHQLHQLLKVGKDLCIHWMAQMGALFKDSKPHVVVISSLQLHTVFRSFGDFLGVLIILDEVIRAQFVLKEHWSKYRQMVTSVQADSESFVSGTESDKLLALDRDMFFLEKEVVSGHTFKNMLHELVRFGGKGFAKGAYIQEKFQSYLAQVGPSIEKDFLDENDELKPIAVSALFVFSAMVFSASFDWRKFYHRYLLEPVKKVVAVPIGSSVLWIPELFLNKFPVSGVSSARLYDVKTLQLCATNRQNYIHKKNSNFQREVIDSTVQVGTWSIRLQEVFYSKNLNQLKLDDLSKRCNLLLYGLKLAQTLSQNFRLTMSLHAHFGKPVSKQIVCLLCQVLELLKEIQATFFRFSVQIENSAIYILQHVLNTALNNLKGVQKLMCSPEFKKMDELRADSLSVMKILENSMKGPPSTKRLLVAKVTLDWTLSNAKFWKGDDAALILPAAIERISVLVNLGQRINELCNGSELFWHRIILSTYFSAIYKNEVDAQKLPLIFMVIQDCYRFLENSPHREQAKKSFVAEVNGYIKKNLQEKLCQEVETDLRLMAHTHLQVQAQETITSPFRVGVQEHYYLLMCPTLSFESEHSVNFRLMTEYYLSKTFYNLASVALHDWQSYATMRALASEKYLLDVGDDHLPGHSLEQGRDILEIVRNLPTFVQEFTYNLNNQVFIQIGSKNKHLDTVNIRHLANSMRTHGTGMTNTTVNAAYQFLRPKMHLFSQCLFEEQIRSRLSKDIRLFKQARQDPSLSSFSSTKTHSSSQPPNFPFKVAEKFKKGIKKLGVQEGLTWLDKFRVLISHIGNALGFVRLVRSGGLHYLAGGCRFIPDLDDISAFSISSGEKGVTSEIYSATDEETELKVTQHLELAIKGVDSTLSKFFGGEDYFGLLVKAFRAGCMHDRNAHLKNFYVLIPALTLSYVDHMRQCKEMLAKKAKTATIFTDDGFPMGVAYLLQVLGQDDDFDSLGWFHSVKQHYEDEKQKEMQIITESKNDEKLEQTSKLTAKRFHDQLQEFELLRFNLSSARIFFQYNNNSSSKTHYWINLECICTTNNKR
ncbi:WASH complex subunit 4 isoform X3 [Folsomia candida]|uniref:WASH complex subunit 4 isoform X3 n=1 Tax=Folsomia candida TaxID=158441 RepID=UPI0016051A0A|nr:WASH complex subunit 4 isoform X3 [Folsomia candida]